MQVSVVIPTYERRRDVLRAIESVRAGTQQPVELIVVDDGSTDRTASAVSALEGVDLIRLPDNRGVAAARNAGIRAAKGQWIALLDSDDWWLTDHLERLTAFATEHPNLRIMQTRERWYRQGRRVNPKRHHVPGSGDLFERSLGLCLVSSSAVLFERRLFDQVGGYDERLPACEDYDLWLRIALEEPFGLVDVETIEKDGGRSDQLSVRTWGLDRFRVFSLAKLLDRPLTAERREATRQTALAKLDILRQGAEKRGRQRHVAAYERWTAAFEAHTGPRVTGTTPSLLESQAMAGSTPAHDPILGSLRGRPQEERDACSA